MTHKTLIRQTVAAILLAADTYAGTNVRDERSSSPSDKENDGLIVFNGEEIDVGLGQAKMTERTANLVIVGWVTIPTTTPEERSPETLDTLLAARCDELEEQVRFALSDSKEFRALWFHPGDVSFSVKPTEIVGGRRYSASFQMGIKGKYRHSYERVIPANAGDFKTLAIRTDLHTPPDIEHAEIGADIPIPQ